MFQTYNINTGFEINFNKIFISSDRQMAQEQDEFYVEPQEEQVRQIQQLQLPTQNFQKVASMDLPKNSNNLKMLQVHREQQYQYKRFKFDKKQQQEEEQQDQQYQQEYESPFTEFYNSQQLVYKKYHNESIAKFKDTFYFAGSFVHKNIFSANPDQIESPSFVQIAKQYYDIKNEDFPQQNLQQGQLKFDSQFQSGNLFAAFKVSNIEYDLVMQMDTNSRGNNQWFYFAVQNMVQGKEYTFNVINFTKNDSLFNYGMEPAVYSTQEGKKQKNPQKSWKRMGMQVSYKRGQLPKQNSRRHYYKLSFKLIAKYADDRLYIAHSYPYDYQKLLTYLEDKCTKNKEIITRITIGKTLSKRPIQVLKIMAPSKAKKDNRKAIIIMARQHPGQTQGSYVCQGTVNKIISKSKQSDFLRKNYIFYIVPMLNIDGVVYGHYRTNLSGKDLNRKWDVSEKETMCPQVTSVKAFLADLSKQRQIRFIIDLHGHSKKLNSFFYGNPCVENPQVVRILPYACSKITQAIQFYDCTFSTDQCKRKAARVYLSYLYKQLHVYTFQSSFYAYFKDGKKVEFTPDEYRDLGGHLITGLSMQLEHQVKYQQSFQFNLSKNNNKQFLNSPFVKMISQLKQNKNLLDAGNQETSGSDSKPEQGEIDANEVEIVKPLKLSRPPSLTMPEQNKSIRLSRKGNREIKDINRPTRNMRFLQISKINSVLPDKYQLCLQPIRPEIQTKMNQSLKSSVSTAIIKHNCDTQTEKDKQQNKYKQVKKTQIQSSNLSMSLRIEDKPKHNNSNERRYSSVVRTQNRNNIIFKIDFMNQQTRQEKIAHIKKISKTVNLKHAFSQTIISFRNQREKQKQKIKQEFKIQNKMRASQTFLPSVETPDRDQKKWSRNNKIKYDTVRIGNKRQAEIFLNGVVKKYLGEKGQPKPESFSIFTKALQRPKSLRKKQSKR